MRFLVDMNLSPEWVGYLERAGYDAVHWSSIGQANAGDDTLMSWARDHERIVLTCDLDFGAMLSLSGQSKPSVIQIRSEATLPSLVGSLVVQAISQAEADLASGALLTLEAGRSRLRILPFG